MSDTCWSVSCYNYGYSAFWCDCGGDAAHPRPHVGSEGGCYE